jgi:hypothetical protein
MKQLHLFPPPGTPTLPLPDDVRTQARLLLAELLVAALEPAADQPTSREGDSDEPDPENPS